MRYETKGGLFKPKPIPVSQVYKNRKYDERSFAYIISNFSEDYTVRSLLFRFIDNLSFRMSVRVFKRQLKLLEPLTLDEQIRILNNTVEKGWNSLTFEYERIMSKMEKP